MNFALNGGSGLMLLVPVAVWLIWLYLIVRFLRAFERGVHAHERIANSLTSSTTGARAKSVFDDRTT